MSGKKPVQAVQGHAAEEWLAAFKHWARSPDVVMAVDAAGMVLRLNRPVGSVTPHDIKQQPIWQLVSEAATIPLRAAIQHAFHPGLAQVVEVDFPSGAGRRWYRIQVIPCGSGDRQAALLHCVDIDARRRELERLQEMEGLMHDGEGLAHLGTWYWDITEPHATWSAELYHIYGLDPETHVPTYDDYLTRIHPEDVDRVKYATERVFQEFESYSHDERIRHTDGTWRHLHTWARPVLHDDGTLRALQGVCLDITDRKNSELALAASEERQGLILDYAGLGIASITADGVIEDANATFDAVTGIGTDCEARFEDAGDLGNAISELVRGEARVRTVAVVPRSEPERVLRLLLTPVVLPERSFVVAVAQDVTAEALAREADAKIRELEARHASHARVVGMAGHELKNPLTPILMQLALLQRGALGTLDDRQAAALAKIEHQTGRIQHLLQDLLDASKADAGALVLDKSDADVAQLVKTATESHQATAASFDVVLVTHGPETLTADIDAGRLVQVVDNLVINALRFTPSGHRVDVTVTDHEDTWSLEVADEGVGIPLESQDDIFDAYVTGDIPAPHDIKSNGLGLFVVRGIVQAHGGTLALKSRPGDGTSIKATFPK